MTARPDPPARILIVDDEPLNVDYLEQELDSLGFVTETAADGLEALVRVSAAPPDLVLLDVMMPRMDGISALRVLKQDPDTRLIPVVLMTALNGVEDRVRGIEAGADDFLSKPVDDRELLARIRTALSLKRALGGTPGEGDPGELVAVFDDPDERSRSAAAVDAAFAVLEDDHPEASQRVHASAAVGVGPARVGSRRVTRDGETRWGYGVEGPPVDGAVALARAATEPGVTVTAEAAAFIGDRFSLEPLGEVGYHVLSPASGDSAPAAVLPSSNRRIRTILVTDIVGSTRTAERVGDRDWTELLAAHDRATRAELVLFGGEEINTTGDGFVAAFDGPGRAIRCALAVMDRLEALDLRIRAGIHSGEVEHVPGGVEGIAGTVATRIATLTAPAEVLVSATARELAAGAGLDFVDRGEHVLKGVSEPRRLYSARERNVPPEPVAPAQEDEGHEFPTGLTAREVDVLKLVAVGMSDAEAADRLYVSVRTVNAHLRSIYRKLGVRSRAAAGRFAQTNGLL
jgi:DNA-binding NarL/FixJ family response regulator